MQRIDGEWALAQRGGDLFPQQSVSKLWVAMSILAAVDYGRVGMVQKVRLGPGALVVFPPPRASRSPDDPRIPPAAGQRDTLGKCHPDSRVAAGQSRNLASRQPRGSS